MSALASEAAKLKRALANLRRDWELLAQLWHDPVSERYERETLEPLRKSTEKAVRALEEVATVHVRLIEQARRFREQI